MYKVFLVDDEELVIKSLMASVDWNSFGFEIAGYALSGGEAYERIKEIKPDIVFTDIRMPGISGLELIKNIKKTMVNTICIVISGYAEFAYAQKAINYGAFGYCLKPFDEEEIGSYLNKAKVMLDSHSAKNVPDFIDLIANEANDTIGFDVSKYTNPTFKTILKYVNNNFCSDISIQSISKDLNVNASYISQLFKKEVGITFTEYLSNLRIDRACNMLKTTDLSISEIAEKTGYNDFFYFSRIFKKIKGMPPSKYRNLKDVI